MRMKLFYLYLVFLGGGLIGCGHMSSSFPEDLSDTMEAVMGRFEYGQSEIYLHESVGYETRGGKFQNLFLVGSELPARFSERFWVRSDTEVLFNFLLKGRDGKERKIGTYQSTNLNKGPGRDAIPFINLTIHISTAGVLGVSEYSQKPLQKIGVVKIGPDKY